MKVTKGIRLRRFIKENSRKMIASALIVILAIVVSVTFREELRAALGGFSNNSQSAVNLSKGLVAHWKLDGDAKDSTPYLNHGTVSGGITSTNDRKGSTESAYNFDGTGYITTGTNSIPSGNSGEKLTTSFWIKPSALTGDIFYKSGEWLVDMENSGEVWIRTWGGNNNGTNNKLVADTWQHVVVTWDVGTGHEVYVNGEFWSSKAASNADTSSGSTNVVISENYNGRFQGDMDDLRIYNRLLNSDEIQALYEQYEANVSISDTQKGLVGHWKFDGEMKDSTPFGNDGTAGGNASPTGTDRNNSTNSTVVFDGNGDYMSHSTTGIDSRNGTVTGWVKPSSSSDWGFWQTHNSSGQNWVDWISMFSYTNDNFYFRMGDGSNCCNNDVTFSNSTYITPNEWNHLAFTWSDSIMEAYVDGERVAYRNNPTLQNNVDSAARIGWGHDRQLNGQIDDFRIYNRPLNSSEITKLYESYNPSVGISDLQKGLIGHWSFMGDSKDNTPYSNHGNVVGATLTTDRLSNSNNAYSFDETANSGSGSYIDVSNTNYGLSEITVSAWIRPSASSDSRSPIVRIDQFYFQHYGNDRLATYWYGWNSQGYHYSSVNSVPTDTWSHVAVTWDQANGTRLFVNGQLDTEIPNSGVGNSTNWVKIGQENSSRRYQGKIDDVRIWSRALSQPEIERLYETN